MDTILKDVNGFFKFIGRVFGDIINALWTTDKQMIMTDATNLLHAEGVAIQNAQPGINTKDFIALLVSTGAPLLVGDLVALGVADQHIIASTIAVDLKIADGGGNAGVVTTGDGASTTPTT